MRVVLNKGTGEFHVYEQRRVVDQVVRPHDEISLDQAQLLNPDYVLGDIVEQEVFPKDFSRVAVMNAKQIITQRIREAERNLVYDKFVGREDDIVTGIVQRVERGTVFVELGSTIGILAANEQIPGERYLGHDRMKFYIVEVKKTGKGPQIMLSRTHPGLLKRLFELEVPEIHDGVVEIKSVSREAGMRSKIAVFSKDSKVDAVGACVGHKGMRVQHVVDELRGEKSTLSNTMRIRPPMYRTLCPRRRLSGPKRTKPKRSAVSSSPISSCPWPSARKDRTPAWQPN